MPDQRIKWVHACHFEQQLAMDPKSRKIVRVNKILKIYESMERLYKIHSTVSHAFLQWLHCNNNTEKGHHPFS
jgi:hypothetical protein